MKFLKKVGNLNVEKNNAIEVQKIRTKYNFFKLKYKLKKISKYLNYIMMK